MNTVSDVIEWLGGTTAAATALGLPLSTVSSWKSRDSIPISEWLKIIEASQGFITRDDLWRIKAASLERGDKPNRRPSNSIEAAE